MLTKNHFTGEDEGEKPKEIVIIDPDTEVCITVSDISVAMEL
jgi:hypothetical protein